MGAITRVAGESDGARRLWQALTGSHKDGGGAEAKFGLIWSGQNSRHGDVKLARRAGKASFRVLWHLTTARQQAHRT